MTTSYDVDVIILSWNRIEDTIDAIKSALGQEGVRVGTFVVDQGSEPEGLARLQAFCDEHPSVHLEALGRNLGVPGGRNYATRMGSAPLIVGLDNDAEFKDPQTLARVVQIFNTHPDLGAIGFRILVHSTGEDDLSSWGYPKHLWEDRDKPFDSANFIGAGHAYRRSVFEEVEGYDDSLFFCWEELDLGHRIINAGHAIRYEPSAVITHKVSPEARVRWKGGRFYYTVRNRLFLEYKSGMPFGEYVQMTGGLMIRGLRNGLVWDSLRGLFDAGRMCLGYRPTDKTRALNKLTPEAREFINTFYRRGEYGFWERFRRALSHKMG